MSKNDEKIVETVQKPGKNGQNIVKSSKCRKTLKKSRKNLEKTVKNVKKPEENHQKYQKMVKNSVKR